MSPLMILPFFNSSCRKTQNPADKKVHHKNYKIDCNAGCWNGQAISFYNLLSDFYNFYYAHKNYQRCGFNHAGNQVHGKRNQGLQSLREDDVKENLTFCKAYGAAAFVLMRRNAFQSTANQISHFGSSPECKNQNTCSFPAQRNAEHAGKSVVSKKKQNHLGHNPHKFQIDSANDFYGAVFYRHQHSK